MSRERQLNEKDLLISIIVAFVFIVVLSLILRYFEGRIEKNIHSSIKIAQAATVKYQAKILNYKPGQKIKLKANSTAILKIQYQNRGATWLNTGATALKLKTNDSGKNFVHSQWLSSTIPTKLYFPKIEIGEPIWFEIPIKTPKINGVYQLNFFLIAGSTTVANSQAEFQITIFGGQEPPKVSKPVNETVRQEIFKITTEQKSKLPIIIGLANFQIKSNSETLIQKVNESVQINFDFNLKRYFINDKDGVRIMMTDQPFKFIPTDQKSNLELTIEQKYTFCANLEFVYQPESQNFSVFSEGPPDCQPKLIRQLADSQPTDQYFWQSIPAEINIPEDYRFQEPTIRVGLFYQTSDNKDKLPIKIRTLNQQPYEIRTKKDYLLTRATTGDLLEIDYDFKLNRYFLSANGQRLAMTDEPLKFIADSPETIFEIASWNNGPFWGMNVNDNDYRGNLEVQYNPSTKRFWLINELPMEKYVAGIMEVWDSWPYEFLKAQKIAARTYAMFRYLNPKYTNTPDDEPIFTVRSTQADQVYRGYQAEMRNSNIVRAAEETRGMIAVYNNDPILAYYFAQTDGQTRDSYQVRMTAAPVDYLKAKKDPPGEGRTLKGHGVGMPQQGGKVAAEQGANFSQILKYYYTGIEIKKLYP